MLEDQLSTEFINRKLVPFLNDESISDFNKWIKIKQELNMFMKRKINPIKPLMDQHKSVLKEEDVINKNVDTNLQITQNYGIFETPKKKSNSAPELEKKNKYTTYFEDNELDEKPFKISKRKIDEEDYAYIRKKPKSIHENTNVELKKKKLFDGPSEKSQSKNIISKSKGNESKTNTKHQYDTRSVQKGESWIKWTPLY